MQKEKLVELLKDAETLEKAFEVLKGNGINVSIVNASSGDRKILLPKADYVIFSSWGDTDIALHPYGSKIFYQPIFPKKP